MKNPHFFKAYSRMGIVNNPKGQKDKNFGVENAPDVIIDNKFLKKITKYSMSDFRFPFPEEVSSKLFFNVLAKNILDFKSLINNNLIKDEMQIVIGGDHSVTFPSVLALMERVKDLKKIGFILIDSHGDINLSKDTPTGNFHGMYLRPLFDNFDIQEVEKIVPEKLNTNNLLFIGNLDLDEGEAEFIDKNNIKSISRKDFLDNKRLILKKISDFIKSFEYLHVSFDGDVFDKSIFPATGIPSNNGFYVEEILEMINIILPHPNLTFDIAEFNPSKKGAKKSKEIIQKILFNVII